MYDCYRSKEVSNISATDVPYQFCVSKARIERVDWNRFVWQSNWSLLCDKASWMEAKLPNDSHLGFHIHLEICSNESRACLYSAIL